SHFYHGKIIEVLQQKDFKLVVMKFIALINHLSFGPVDLMVWECFNVVKTVHQMFGVTYSTDFLLGIIRSNFYINSDAVETAKKVPI
ncbi:unnamed protein product, partial [Ceratitis capitata]